MQFTKASLVAVLVSMVAAQTIEADLAKLPACSIQCLLTAGSSAGCAQTDYACQCGSKKAAITASATPCILKACTVPEALTVQSITDDICKIQSAMGGAAASTTAAASSAVAASSSAVAATSSVAAATSSVASVVSSVVSVVSSSAAAVSSAVVAPTSATRASTSAPAAVSSIVPASGNQAKAAAGVIGAAVLAALAL